MPTLFSRIASGEIPSVRLYADDQTFAFLDINPASKGHALVIPRAEHADLFTMPPDLVAAVALTVQRVALAIQSALQPDGINIVQNNGGAAGQTVFHYHVHLIPRWQGDAVLALWQPQQIDRATLESIATEIKGAMIDARD